MAMKKEKNQNIGAKIIYHFDRLQHDITGATMAEYSVIAIVVVFAGILAFTNLGHAIAAKVNEFLAGF